ncbi:MULTISPECIES: contractile injection system protein, VgrG/Pvc8 family [unclassified Agrobacterium]|uniref:phage late control D family protein n=1 Tax=unclassified Agrobacterium TaxID=2632611 RepID=UPI0024494293|nr:MULTISPECIES: contractile injection system protein, VgrG/Pvc8 family [unclassified Agrobacterium]MDH0613427.1 contractile injection system protein, VgrG/Pvc8 family [Agrobacterium sp. GD03872]MDH0697344.1 contractile injection system protein, VgrG/Pvc8 family [Agrobacterium sp. GD03871]MDH1060867.1 contractile injection system protein, VgrG/Pvc8 family [Agrobacterium sp. GD03992]MDH2211451.1 contractile injection system protein, VgrG/Pvc8 family [Agrobacterium sp. GD03643]MDH2220710.1 contr
MPKPVFSIIADGVDVTTAISPALISMTIVDGEGRKNDTLQLDIDDVDGSIAAPRTGVIIRAQGGYEGNMRDFGLFSVDSVVYSGWPQKITIGAQAVAAKSLARHRAVKAYPEEDFPTYGDIFAAVAEAVQLPLRISASVADVPNPYHAQTDEDSQEFMLRIGEQIGASVTVKAGQIVVVPKGAGQAVSGSALDLLRVAVGENLIDYTVTQRDVPQHSSVEATWYDRKKNERKVVQVETGQEGHPLLLKRPYSGEVEAMSAAEAAARKLQRIRADATFLIDGTPGAMAEAWATVSGIRADVDGKWRIKQATHSFSATRPYTTSLDCEVPNDE